MGIFWAAKEGDVEEVSKLLDADPTLVHDKCMRGTALTVAAEYGQLEVVRLLTYRGADIGATSAQPMGKTALHLASERGHRDIVAFLLDEGGESNGGPDHEMPLVSAANGGHLEVVQLLLDHMRGQGRDPSTAMQAALQEAARGGHTHVAAYLLAQGSPPEIPDGRGQTPLITAAGAGDLGVVQMLVECVGGRNLEASDSAGKTALRHAVEGGHAEVVEYLLGQGAHGDVREIFLTACKRGQLALTRMAARRMQGRGLDDADKDGWTALHWAVLGGHHELVRLQLVTGANHTILDKQGRTPLMLTENLARQACVAMFEWWIDELAHPERRYIVYRAARLQAQRMPTSLVPSYLEARVAGGHALPRVEVVVPQSQEQQEEGAGGSGKRKEASGQGGDEQEADAEEEKAAVLEYVLTELQEDLLTELLEGFHPGW